MKWDSMQAGKWTLHRLEPQANGEERWSLGENGPRAYLTCSEATALLILHGVVVTDILLEEPDGTPNDELLKLYFTDGQFHAFVDRMMATAVAAAEEHRK